MEAQENSNAPRLSVAYEFQVPFYDLDGIQMVWHGNYVKYLEDARERFGAKYGFEYLHIFNSGYTAPVVDIHIQYRNSARISERLRMEAAYVPTRAAKMQFKYLITRVEDGAVIIEAETTQLFVSRSGVFEVANPDFYAEWKRRWAVGQRPAK